MKQKEEWDSGALWWHEKTGEKGRPHQEKDIDPVLLKLLGDVSGRQILDAGCGNGYLSRLLARSKAIVTAFDFSSELIKLAQKTEDAEPLGITFLTKDAADLNGLDDGSFDSVVANMSLMDIENCAQAVKEFSRVLRPKGTFLFSITHPAFFDFGQEWVVTDIGGKRRFARAVSKYMSTGSEQRNFTPEFSVHQHHRPVSTYADFLHEAGFLIQAIKEIVTSQMPAKASAEQGDVTLSRSKYQTEEEKLIKVEATKEIPFFLVMKCVKP